MARARKGKLLEKREKTVSILVNYRGRALSLIDIA
jgi:hypothetical protein